ncbi:BIFUNCTIONAL INHIBITOR/LIPID-TRANSFER PROTEIN/SEED STORAGE 2S ALBUMIN SUPERFAMILY PROTEIN [Salix purpurea]|uniref:BIFUNCTIONAL INHIBITOR/LIPID-TRANSFER PROTEIN/SEED STORAGE 2S ALBUMIN SUPERFAMILY PROTEIN n=1 Tax=Salix purpurea TaxID=77065 RepID=A0A9Q0WVL2_SALPP|nr:BIFUNCTIONAL INHIBITOR/LIPID-TRANSFER PROTEIN/SEED STORAGE 2S ALBUMIN SUPERFAMILY PROTEIN [Salix purpurea]
MASKGVQFSLLLVLAMMLCHGATAQSGCTGSLVSLAPCLNYVTGNSSTPSPSCCSQLATIVQSQPRCLCALVNGGGSSLGIAINQTLALALPTACNVQTPPISRCNAADGPAAPPASSPAIPPSDTSDATPEAPTTVSTPSIPAGSGSKTVPTSTGTSDASIVRKQLHLDIFVILSVLCASSIFGF